MPSSRKFKVFQSYKTIEKWCSNKKEKKKCALIVSIIKMEYSRPDDKAKEKQIRKAQPNHYDVSVKKQQTLQTNSIIVYQSPNENYRYVVLI